MAKLFYNTVNLKNQKLQKAIKKAATQQDKVYLIFKTYPKRNFTSRDIEGMVKILLTSVHRCLTNLTSEGFIEKTETKREGIYGVVNHTWRLK